MLLIERLRSQLLVFANYHSQVWFQTGSVIVMKQPQSSEDEDDADESRLSTTAPSSPVAERPRGITLNAVPSTSKATIYGRRADLASLVKKDSGYGSMPDVKKHTQSQFLPLPRTSAGLDQDDDILGEQQLYEDDESDEDDNSQTSEQFYSFDHSQEALNQNVSVETFSSAQRSRSRRSPVSARQNFNTTPSWDTTPSDLTDIMRRSGALKPPLMRHTYSQLTLKIIPPDLHPPSPNWRKAQRTEHPAQPTFSGYQAQIVTMWMDDRSIRQISARGLPNKKMPRSEAIPAIIEVLITVPLRSDTDRQRLENSIDGAFKFDPAFKSEDEGTKAAVATMHQGFLERVKRLLIMP
ncbi:hypothetical protein BT69DRAFT_1317212 [Atractiella rhizophila]|nr:hypothetical protein BT69DRAFT_1317212 [Atractiella rhizophila]